MGLWTRISPTSASSVIILFLMKQAKGSLLKKTTTEWNKYKQECLKMLQESTIDTGSVGHVYRVCLDEGIWQTKENSTDIWRDSSECSEKNHFKKNEEEHKLLTTLQLLYTIGYYFSLISLVLALLILSLLSCSNPVCGPLGNKQIQTGEHWVNFGIFLKILRMLISKLKAQQMSFHDYKYRLARSTLVLIPLLGIHEFVFTFITDEQVEGLPRHIRLFIQLTMSSFHGFLVAVLYCFANGEVKAELQKQWSRFLLADPFGCKLCFLGENIKYLRKCSQKRKKQHLSSKHRSYLEVSTPWGMQLQQVLVRQRTDFSPEPGSVLPSLPRISMSDSSEGEFTTGETTEEVFEESEI
ncbi:hypothetical protein BTVI_98262 [Pitangus sulphuratus]|nr:hypothetical protein BTVI_98262 [Pitangus sulphuratus]